jgi:hypothetical protein
MKIHILQCIIWFDILRKKIKTLHSTLWLPIPAMAKMQYLCVSLMVSLSRTFILLNTLKTIIIFVLC